MISEPCPSLWEASCAERVDTAPASGSISADLAVIGGGYTGCSAALQAARDGASVVLLEANHIGYGGSGRNHGLVNAGLWLPPNDVIGALGDEAGRRLLGVLAGAPSEVFNLVRDYELQCEGVNKGTLHLAHSPAGFKDLQKRYQQGVGIGAPLQLVDNAEAVSRSGANGVYGALFDPRAGTIQPLGYCRGLARAAVSHGARLFAQTPVTRLQRREGVWQLDTPRSVVRAKTLLVSTNAYHLGIEAPYKPSFARVAYALFATTPLSLTLRQTILPGGEGCWDTATVMSSFRMDQSGRLVFGGIGRLDGSSAAIHRNWARRKMQAWFPELAKVPLDFAWHGDIAMTQDHIPKILAFAPDAYACFGYSGRGIGPGTVFGRALSQALLTQTPSCLPLDPIEHYSERFCRTRSVYYRTGATLAHLLKDRFSAKSGAVKVAGA